MNDGEDVDNWLARRERIKATGINGNGMGMPLPIAVQLLPTPQAADGTGGRIDKGELGGVRESGAKRAITLASVVHHQLLPTTDWGPYAAAVARWETVTGRPAPSPVKHDGKGGKARLNAELPEWMMGWPAGHVTDPAIGLTRAEQLKACGNGVVPQQAAAALRTLLARPGDPAPNQAVSTSDEEEHREDH